MAGFTGDFGCQIVLYQAFAVLGRRSRVNASGNIMKGRRVTACAVKVLPINSHVNIQRFVRIGQGRIQVTVFYTIPTTAVKMTGTAVFSGRTSPWKG